MIFLLKPQLLHKILLEHNNLISMFTGRSMFWFHAINFMQKSYWTLPVI